MLLGKGGVIRDSLIWAGSTGTLGCGASLTPGTLTSANYTQTLAYDANTRLTRGPAGTYIPVWFGWLAKDGTMCYHDRVVLAEEEGPMSHIVHVPLSDDVYQILTAYAAQHGMALETLLVDVLEQGMTKLTVGGVPDEQEALYDAADDPLAEFLGAFEADVPDLVQRHDSYLGEAYAHDQTSKE
jgi:hypothetical protein